MNAPAGKPRASRDEYTCRINRVMDYVERHMAERLSLETLARVACLSPFHFHKVFGAMMGETLGDFVQRVRIERAATLLLTDRQKSITELALECGYSSSAAFARAFKKAHGTSASEWREKASPRASVRADGMGPALPPEARAEVGVLSHWLDQTTRAPQWTIRCPGKPPVRVEVKSFPETHPARRRSVSGRSQGGTA